MPEVRTKQRKTSPTSAEYSLLVYPNSLAAIKRKYDNIMYSTCTDET